jgi:hypothetical protein
MEGSLMRQRYYPRETEVEFLVEENNYIIFVDKIDIAPAEPKIGIFSDYIDDFEIIGMIDADDKGRIIDPEEHDKVLFAIEDDRNCFAERLEVKVLNDGEYL